MIKGLLIGQINDFNIMINHLNDFLPLIDNWAICDSTMLKNRCFKKNFNLGIEFVEKCLISNKEFTIRAGIDLLIAFYINDNYIDYVLKKVVEVKFDAYYVKMALAWLVSICFIKYPDKTNILIVNEMLDKFTHNKAISKICDSYRVDQEVKDKLKTYRIKTI